MIDKTCSYYDGDEDCHKCVKYGYIFSCPSSCPELKDYREEVWNGIHSQVTAPKETFEKIYNDDENEDDDI